MQISKSTIMCSSSLLLAWLLHHFAFNSDVRAVEFFIRDKYEKKKYSKNVTNGRSVCTDFNQHLILYSKQQSKCPQLIHSLFTFQPKDTKKEKEPERGNKVLSHTISALYYYRRNIAIIYRNTVLCSQSEESRAIQISPIKNSEPSVNLLGLGKCILFILHA